MAILSFNEKNRLLVKLKNADYFYKDLELFKKYYPGHSLNNELANVTKFSKGRLSEQVILLLLDKVAYDTILENRGITPPRELTYEERVAKVIEKFGLDYVVKNTAELAEIGVILGHPEPDSLISFVSMVGKTIQELLADPEDTSTRMGHIDRFFDGMEKHNQRISKYINEYGIDYVFTSKEDVENMFALTGWPLPDPQDETHLKIEDLIGFKFSELGFSHVFDFSDEDELIIFIESVYRNKNEKESTENQESVTTQVVESQDILATQDSNISEIEEKTSSLESAKEKETEIVKKKGAKTKSSPK